MKYKVKIYSDPFNCEVQAKNEEAAEKKALEQFCMYNESSDIEIKEVV